MFTSWEFWLFTLVILALTQVLPRRTQNLLVLAASYLVYAYLDLRFMWLIAAMTLVNFWLGRLIAPKRKGYLAAGVIFNLLTFAFFKYASGLAEFVNPILTRLGVAASPLITDLLLPLGLSFYTLRLIAYLFEVYNAQVPASDKLIDFGLYVAFFPQLAAGPIVRAKPFLTSLKSFRGLTQQQFIDGLTLIFLGFFYKNAIADPLAVLLPTLAPSIAELTPSNALLSMLLYSFRIYADFAGYSLLAIGVSTWFGLPTVENFRQPYFARSVTEFWNRWHISLSTWLRDYVFYPISRSMLRRWRNAPTRFLQVIALMVTMLASGLWHGTGWQFIAWGALYGLTMSLERLLQPRVKIEPDRQPRLVRALGSGLGMIYTFAVVSAAWVLFSSTSIAEAGLFFGRLTAGNPFTDLTALWWTRLLTPLSLLLIVDLPQAWTNNALFIWQIRPIWRIALCALLLLSIFIFGSQTHAPFVYFQF
ncbi:MAG: MBOAT family protein [Anaerolineae bacterium]|nr:MBOAT family protein [Anaerolineae bacterium]